MLSPQDKELIIKTLSEMASRGTESISEFLCELQSCFYGNGVEKQGVGKEQVSTQAQRMVQQQQMMISNLKRQLADRDKHYHKTIQTTIQFKDMEMVALREQIGKLEEEIDELDELRVQNFKMKKELNGMRHDHQESVFDNLLDKIGMKKSDGKPKEEDNEDEFAEEMENAAKADYI